MIKTKLTKNYEMTIDQKDFDMIFHDSFDSHGYEITGTNLNVFREDYPTDENYVETYEKLPTEITNIDDVLLVKQSNVKSHVINHIVTIREGFESDNVGWKFMLDTIKKHKPNELIERKTNVDCHSEITNELKHDKFYDELVDFIIEKLIDESQLTINGQKFVVITTDHDSRNFANEFFKNK